MEGFRERVREVKVVFWCLQGYSLILELLISFLSFAIMFQVIGRSIWLSIFPTLIVFFLLLFYRIRTKDIIGIADASCPQLRQRLKTAYDNKGERNIIVDDLKDEVAIGIRNMESSALIEPREIAKRVLVTVVLVFVLLTIAVIDFANMGKQLLDKDLLGGSIKGLTDSYGELLSASGGSEWDASDEVYKTKNMQKLGAEPGGEKPGYAWGPIPGTGGGTGTDTNEDIFGESSAANLGNEELGFELHPEYGGDIEIKRSDDNLGSEEFSLSEVESTETCKECNIGPEYEEIVRRYFEKIVDEE